MTRHNNFLIPRKILLQSSDLYLVDQSGKRISRVVGFISQHDLCCQYASLPFHSCLPSHRMLFRMVRICIRILRIKFKGFEFAFEFFESRSNGCQNLHSNASNSPFHSCLPSSNLVRMVTICIRMLRNPFEWFEFAFKCFESLSNGSNLYSNASNPFRMVRICI